MKTKTRTTACYPEYYSRKRRVRSVTVLYDSTKASHYFQVGCYIDVYPAWLLVIVVLLLASITKDQVVWLRTVGFEAAFIGECETSDKELLGGKRRSILFLEALKFSLKHSWKCLRYVCDKKNPLYVFHLSVWIIRNEHTNWYRMTRK